MYSLNFEFIRPSFPHRESISPRNREHLSIRANVVSADKINILNRHFQEFFISLESIIGKYEDLIMKKIGVAGFGLLQDIIADLDQVDSIRCFFAALFLARDQKVDLEQAEDDIKIIVMKDEIVN